ncbi:MAG: MFS transporter [candidate division Zixibacteria bacterium]|nr:MFS transporter [candidate division Zixibacteria bacterium]
MTPPARLFNRNFFLLWQGQLISKIGNEAHYIALAFWVKHATGSATLMGAFMMAATIPRVILGPFAGAFTDRHSRRGIIIVADIICGISVLSLALLLWLLPDAIDLLLWWMFIVTAVVATVSSFFSPAMSASIPDIVPQEKIAAANSAGAASNQISGFLGLGVGGLLYRVLGAPLLFFFDGLSYVVAGFFSSFAKIPQKLPEKRANWRETAAQIRLDVKEGFAYVWRQPGLRALFIAASALNFFFTPVAVLLPFFVEDTLGSTSDWMGYMLAGMGVGSLLGYLVAGAIRLPGPTRSRIMIFSMIGMSILIGAVGLVANPVQGLILLFFTGILNGYINVNLATVLQLTTPSEIRGRVFGLLVTLSAGLTPIAMGLSGILADLVSQNIPLIFVGCGGFATAVVLAASFNHSFRDYLGFEPPKASPNGATSEGPQ